MTLIATTLNRKIPFLISDLLWSGENVGGVTKVPTTVFEYEEYLPKGEKDKPARLGQKMYIVADHVCIIFAGLNFEIITFIKTFKATFKRSTDLSVEKLHQFLEAYELSSHFTQSSFLLMYVNPKIKNQGLKFHVPKPEHLVESDTFQVDDSVWNVVNEPTFEETMAFGSGVKGFLNIVREAVKFVTHFPPNPFIEAVQRNTVLVARLLTLERVSLYSLVEGWGAGFELAYFNGNRFEKIDKIAYVISHSKFDPTGDIGLPIPMLIMYYRYVNEILYITALEVFKYQISETGTHHKFLSLVGDYKATIFEVEGLDLDDINVFEMPKDFSFTTEVVAMGYSLELSEHWRFNPAFFNFGPAVAVSYHQKVSVEVNVYKEIAEEVRQMVKSEYPRLSK